MIDSGYQQVIVALISKHLPTSKIYLYGSRARNTQRQGSDVDIALDDGAPISWTTLANLRADLEETIMPLTVDLVDIHAADAVFLEKIKKDWIEWKKN